MRLKILGSGGSEGIPVPFCKCNVCKKGEKRKRVGYVVECGSVSFWLELSPDFRVQLLEYGRVPSYFFVSHVHYDHIAGLSEFKQSLIVTTQAGIYPKLLLPNHIFRFFKGVSSFSSFVEESFWGDFFRLSDSRKLEVITLKEEFALNVEDDVVLRSVDNIHSDALSTSLFIDYKGKRFLYLADAEKIDDGIYNQLDKKRADVVIAHTPFLYRRQGEKHLGIEDLKKLKARLILLSHISHKAGRTHEELQEVVDSFSNRRRRFEVVKDGNEYYL